MRDVAVSVSLSFQMNPEEGLAQVPIDQVGPDRLALLCELSGLGL